MANSLGYYDPIFYAQESLIQLRKALGMAGRVHRGYDKTPQEKGSVIAISRPASFTATDVNTSTGGTTQDLKPDQVSITLNQWKEVKFHLTDKELSFTQEKIIEDHIQPAAYALADEIDKDILKLYKLIPWTSAKSTTMAIADITAARKILFNNGAPVTDGRMHFLLTGDMEADLLGISAFATSSGSGDAGVATQLRGSIGTRYGMEFFASQNAPKHKSGTASDVTGALNAAVSAGDTSFVVKSLTASSSFKAGDTLKITGDDQQYAITEDVTLGSAATSGTFKVFPAVVKDAAADAVVTITLPSGSNTEKFQGIAFHQHAFALAMAPLSEIGAKLGAQVATVTDEASGLSLRSRLWYEPDLSQVKVSIDALWGVKILNPNLAVRVL